MASKFEHKFVVINVKGTTMTAKTFSGVTYEKLQRKYYEFFSPGVLYATRQKYPLKDNEKVVIEDNRGGSESNG